MDGKQLAFIVEADCIGCVKCIAACPFDAIMGAAKFMHTVLVDECTGCGDCIEPCPVDCIIMQPVPNLDDFTQQQYTAKAEQRANARVQRKQREADEKAQRLRLQKAALQQKKSPC